MVPTMNFKIANVGMLSQLTLCALRALTLIIQCISPNVDCKVLGNVGMLIYALWITFLDFTLYLRSVAFLVNTTQRRALQVATFVQISISLGIQLYVAAKAFTLPFSAPYCIVLSDFSVQDYTLLNRCILYVWYLLPFIQRAIAAYKSKKEDEAHWIRMGINNVFFSVMIMVTELVAARVSQIASFIPWLQAFFGLVNFTEAQFMMMIIDDTKKKLRSKMNASAASASVNHAISSKENGPPSKRFEWTQRGVEQPSHHRPIQTE